MDAKGQALKRARAAFPEGDAPRFVILRGKESFIVDCKHGEVVDFVDEVAVDEDGVWLHVRDVAVVAVKEESP